MSNTYLWVKTLHIIFMVTWFAGLFYLPRLFVYHAQSEDSISQERFKIMERKLFWGIMTPGALLTFVFGLGLWHTWANSGASIGWLHAKLTLALLLLGYHVWLGKLMLDFKHNRNTHTHTFYRWINELPVLVLFGAVYLVIFKPF